MFSIGFIELLVVAVVALLVIGPDRLPGAVRETAAWVDYFRRQFGALRREIQDQLEELENDAAFADLQQGRKLLDDARNDLDETLRGSKQEAGTKPRNLPKP